MRDVIVTGSGRSGTSLAAGLLACGRSLGGIPYPPRDANPKGFFETHEVNGINEVLLAGVLPRHPRLGAGQRWLGIVPPGADVTSAEVDAEPELAAAMQRVTSARPFCFKDPRFVWTLPAWEPYVADALRLVVFREPAITAASIVKECRSADYLTDVDMTFDRAVGIWSAMYRRVLADLDPDSGPQWRYVHYDQLLGAEGIEPLAAWSGGEIERALPDRALKRTRCDLAVPAEAQALYDELCGRADYEERSTTVRVAVPARSDTAPADAVPEPELSVVLCTYQRRPILERSLTSFEAQIARPGAFELVVVNDGSTDGTRELLEQRAWRVPTTVVQRENGGLAAARNSGLERARGRIVLFVNDDTIAFPDLVERHLEAHADAGEPVAVLGTFEQPRAALDGALMRVLEESDLVFRYGDLRSGQTYDHNRFWTCNVSAPLDLVRAVGGFDESFRHYGAEDIDLGYRLEQEGCRVRYCADARAHHDHVLDLDELKRRQRLVGKAFVRLFHKHPGCLAHPDWSWIRSEDLESLDAEIGRGRARAVELEQAARELAGIDLGAFESTGPTTRTLAERVVRTLLDVLREVNVQWWREGFAMGLREFGLESFAEILHAGRRRDAEPVDASAAGARAGAACEALEEAHGLAGVGDLDLATIVATRVAAALAQDDLSVPEAREAYLQALNDLAVIRFGTGDRRGSRALLRAALKIEPEHELARANWLDVEHACTVHAIAHAGEEEVESTPAPDALNPWVREALSLATRAVGLRDRDVIEVGGAVPPAAARRLGVRSWRGCYLNATPVEDGEYQVCDADARALPWPDGSCDVVFSSCAFEHVHDLDVALAEMARVLRPGGAVVTSFAPIWSCAVGHHCWEREDDDTRVDFLDPALPRWGHLLLDEHEMEWYLGLVFSARFGRRATEQMWHNGHVNRLFEADYRRLFAASGMDPAGMEPMPLWESTPEPSDALRAELERRHPNGGDFAPPGFRGVLLKAGVLAQPAQRTKPAQLTRKGAPS